MNRPIRCWTLPLFLCCLLAASRAWAGDAPSAQSACERAASPPANADETARRYAAGECALQRRQYREAIKSFSELVGIEANPIFRAELGRAYLGAQEYERAREQFLIALQSNPPEAAKRLLRLFIRMADQQRTQAKDWFAQVSVGEAYDSNINSGPMSPGVTVYGLPFTMTQDSMPKSDHALHAAFSAVQNRSLSDQLSWQSDVALDAMKYATYGNYDTSQFSVDTGPHLAPAGGKSEFYLPLGASRATQGGSGYSASWFFSPQFSLRVTGTDLLVASAAIARNRYDAAPAQNATADSLGLAWRRVLGGNWTIEPSLKFAKERAASPAFSDLARTAALSLSGSLPHGLRLTAASAITWADYQEAEAWADAARRDRRRNSSLSLSKELDGGYYASLSWLDLRTGSNLGLYSTARRQLQLQLTKSF
ncbi:MAG TPA: tetratricopeptide repeat protein [Rhodocyclaceae bacterium]|nr:tetratricopeptide repeat protein [Rhodocyclaceae bacterium]